jgi:hypothetical protein
VGPDPRGPLSLSTIENMHSRFARLNGSRLGNTPLARLTIRPASCRWFGETVVAHFQYSAAANAKLLGLSGCSSSSRSARLTILAECLQCVAQKKASSASASLRAERGTRAAWRASSWRKPSRYCLHCSAARVLFASFARQKLRHIWSCSEGSTPLGFILGMAVVLRPKCSPPLARNRTMCSSRDRSCSGIVPSPVPEESHLPRPDTLRSVQCNGPSFGRRPRPPSSRPLLPLQPPQPLRHSPLLQAIHRQEEDCSAPQNTCPGVRPGRRTSRGC